MLKIRLQRVGKKHDPSFRVVLVDSRKGPQSGGFLEVLGSYNAQKGEPQLKGDKIKEWIAKGAQVSDTVHNLLVKTEIIKGKKRDVLHQDKIRKEREKKEAEAKPAEEKEKKEESAAPAAEEPATEEPAAEEPKAEEVKEEEKPAEAEAEKKEETKAEEPAKEDKGEVGAE
ncbi:MAG: 30S ribosomal protein S16 [bacterium]|nr:30S ribosomal protein S16 [bacterium]